MFKADRVAKETALKATPITVEYDSRGKRVRKTFASAFAAKSFYVAKYRAGANPKMSR